jgi:hypothetical protein
MSSPFTRGSLFHEAAAIERQMRVFVIGVDHRLGDGRLGGFRHGALLRSRVLDVAVLAVRKIGTRLSSSSHRCVTSRHIA